MTLLEKTHRQMSFLGNHLPMMIMNYLSDGKWRNQTEIMYGSGIEQAQSSVTLKELVKIGVVRSKKEGKFKYYRVNESRINRINQALDNFIYA